MRWTALVTMRFSYAPAGLQNFPIRLEATSCDCWLLLQELDGSVSLATARRQSSPSKRTGFADSLLMTGLCEEWLVNPSATPPPTPDPAAPSRHGVQLSPVTPTLAISARPRKASSILDTGGSRTFEEGSQLDLLGELDTEQVHHQDHLNASSSPSQAGIQAGSSQVRRAAGSRQRNLLDKRGASSDGLSPVPWPAPPVSAGVQEHAS